MKSWFEWSSPAPEATNVTTNALSICNNTVFDSTKKRSFYCWIDKPGALPLIEQDFTCNFVLYIEHKSNTYHTQFKANFSQIYQLYNIAKKREECFTKRRFPLYIEFKRSNLLREQMYLIEEHMFLYDMLQANIPIHDTFIFIFLRDNHMLSNNNIPQYLQDIINIIVIYSTTTTIPYICYGPKSKWFSKKRKNPTIYDGHTLCQILNKLFNAPLFALRDELYKYLNIDNNIKLIVQSAAGEWLNNLKTIYHESIIKVNSSNDSEKRMTYKKLMTDIRYKYMKFHFAFAVQDPNASFTHWLLKFEGDNNLLTVDWFANSSILVSVLYNTAIEQRIFWYSCKSKKPSFTKRYATCAKCLMPKNTFVTGSDIGNLIHKWMNKYPKYNGLLNNCQHFVRDMFLVFNESKAKKLTKQLQANNVGFLDPVAGANNSVQQKEREKYMKQMLETELIRCKIFREQNSKKLKKLLDETMLTAFYDKLLDAGYYDEDYHTINDNELKNIGMKRCDRIRFLIGSQEKIMAMEQVKSWLINIKLPIYFDAFIANGFDSLYMVQCVTEKELKQMNINMIGHQMQIMKHVAILQQKSDETCCNNKKNKYISNPTDDDIGDGICEKKSDLHMNANELLEYWGLAMYAQKMIIVEQWNDPLDWKHLKDESGSWDLKDLGFKPAHKRKFVAKYQDWLCRKQAAK